MSRKREIQREKKRVLFQIFSIYFNFHFEIKKREKEGGKRAEDLHENYEKRNTQ